MRIVTVSVALAVVTSGCSHWMRVAPDDPRIRYTGRMDRSDPAGPRFSTTGSSVAVRVQSPALRLHLGDVPIPWQDTGKIEANRYELLIDGAPAGVLMAQAPEWQHTVQLSPGEHVVEIVKRTESAAGRAQLLGVDLPRDGRLLSPPERPDRRIEFIGDSLTTGYGNAGVGPQCPFSAETEDGYRSYASIAGRALRAEVHIVAWHGRGIIRNYSLSSTDTVPQLYERTLPEDPASRWDFSRWTPHAVVIAAGNNDFGQPALDIPAFERGYIELVKQVRRRYPEAFIFCANQIVTDDWPEGARHGTLSREAMERIMKQLADAGISRVKSFAFEPAAKEDGLGCVWHPSLRTHQAMADRLRAVVSETMGW